MSLVIVGHGSIGSKFKDELKKRGFPKNSIFIVDNNLELLAHLKKEGYSCFSSIEEMDLFNDKEKIEYAIISNWGPDHINSANQILKFGCKRFIRKNLMGDNH